MLIASNCFYMTLNNYILPLVVGHACLRMRQLRPSHLDGTHRNRLTALYNFSVDFYNLLRPRLDFC